MQDLTPGPTRPDLPVLEGRRSGQGDPLGSVGDTLGDRVSKSNGLGNGKEGRTEPRKPEAECVGSPDWMLPLREGRPRGCPASPFVGAGAQGPHRRTRGHQESGVWGVGRVGILSLMRSHRPQRGSKVNMRGGGACLVSQRF